MHEAFHAYLTFEYIYNPYVSNEYGDLIDQFVEDYGDFQNDAQHIFFVEENIINDIASGIHEYCTNRGYSVDYAYCKKLAWGGLDGTVVFDKLDSTEKSNIREIISAELDTRYSFGGKVTKGETPCD